MTRIDSTSEPTGDGSDEPLVRLERFDGDWSADDPFADLKADMAVYSHADPLETLRGLSETTDIPVGVIARYVLARWATGGSDGLLELGVSGVDHLERIVEDAEVAGTDAARLAAFHAIREVVGWLRAGTERPP